MMGPEPSPEPAPRGFAQPPTVEQMPKWQRLPDRASVRAQLLANRRANLARFRAYRSKRVFPSNTYAGRKLNVWRDEAGHFCAAATIIRMSGQTELVDRVAEQTNFIRLIDVTQGPLMDWILTSGFTQEEIAAIQEPMMPVTRQPVLEPEPDDPVNIASDMRNAETRRLVAKYRQVDAMLVKQQRASLELAVDRVFEHPELARQLVAPT